MTSKVYSQKTTSSQWAMNGQSIEFKTLTTTATYDKTLKEWIKEKPVISWQKPSELGYTKQAEFYIVTFDEVPSMKKRGLKEKVWFKQKIIAKVREDESYMYIWLNGDSQNIQGQNIPLNQFYLKEINRGVCMKLALCDSEYVKIIKGEFEAISAKEAQELSQKWNYVFDSVENDGDVETTRLNVSKYIENGM